MQQIFFGRKFDPIISQSILDKVDAWIIADHKEENMYKRSIPNWNHLSRTRYWQSMFHHLDITPKPDYTMVDIAETLCRSACDVFLYELSLIHI